MTKYLMDSRLAQAILNGDHDHELEYLAKLVNHRQRAVREIRAAGIGIGDRVRLDKISPKYLAGEYGTVADVEDKYFLVRLTDPLILSRARKYTDGRGCVKVPKTAVIPTNTKG